MKILTNQKKQQEGQETIFKNSEIPKQKKWFLLNRGKNKGLQLIKYKWL